MPRNGSGSYSLPAGNPVVFGTTIDETVQNNTMTDIATAISNSLAANGETPVTANIPMATHKFTGLTPGTATNDSIAFGQQTTALNYTASGGAVRTLAAKLADMPSAADFASLDAAIAALSDGDSLYIPVGTFGPLSATLTKGIKFYGAKKPSINAGRTALEKGSIIKGPLIHNADGVEFHNLGVDSGSAVCTALYAGVAQEGLICTVTYATAQHTGFRARNVVSLCKDRTSAVHAFAVERHTCPDIIGVETMYGTHGQAYKTVYGNISHLYASRHGSEGVIIKRDEFADSYKTNFSNIFVECADGGSKGTNGIAIECNRGDSGATPGNMYGHSITNFQVVNANQYGVKLSGATVSTDTISDIGFTNGHIQGCGTDGYTETGLCTRVVKTLVRSVANTQFGFSDTSQSNGSKHVGCTANNNASGFVGFGFNFQTIGCEAGNNTGWGFFAKAGASCYRSSNSVPGTANGTALYGNDAATYWFELGAPPTEIVTLVSTFANSWVNYDNADTTWRKARYWLGADGAVRLSGAIKSGTLNTTAFTLPAGFRPVGYVRQVCAGLNGGTDTACYVLIDASGIVNVVSGTNALVSLDGIVFLPNR
jgi:hypothetical protein